MCICCIDPQHNSPSISRFSFSSSSNCLRATHRTIEHDAHERVDVPVESSRCGHNQGSDRMSSEAALPASCRCRFFRVIVIRYVRETDTFLHRRACLCRACRRMPVENGKLNKVRSGRGGRTKVRSGISSGMIYLTRSVLIRAYYMRDRGPRRAALYRAAASVV